VTPERLRERDGGQGDALVADRYLDDLLAAGDRRADDAPADSGLDPDVRHAARVLRSSLLRVHPSFRFEERLADHLADLAASTASLAAAGGGTVLPFAPRRAGSRATSPNADPLLPAILAGEVDPADAGAVDAAAWMPARRPLIVGSAITSAALSIVGVAWVAWRASRTDSREGPGAMVRAARTAHARRARTDALAAIGIGGHA